MKKIILASTNQGKIAELKKPLSELGFEIETLPSDFPEIIENGLTFSENAKIKAKAVAERLNLPAIADDSGLCVRALDFAPGIFSARYADDYPFLENESKDQRNIRKILDKTKNIDHDRQCAFHCAMAFISPSGHEIIVEEKWEGILLKEAKGENGFGYDPIFFDEEMGLSAAQMDKKIKMSRSHRSKALHSLVEKLKTINHIIKN